MDRREDLIRAALDLFAERPYEEVSVDDVAAAAGVAKGLLYYYFGSKRRLYIKGLEYVVRERRERILAAVAAADPENGIERLERSIDAHLAYVEERAAGYRALVGNIASHPEVREIIERDRLLHIEMIETGLPPEVPRTPAVVLAIEGWTYFADGAVLSWLEHRRPGREQLRDLCVRVLVSAITIAVGLGESIVEEAP